MAYIFFLAFEEEGFGLQGRGEVVATWDEGWPGCLVGVAAAPEVALDEDPIAFEGDESGDFNRGELRPLGSVSSEVDSEKSLVGLVAWAFCLLPLGTGGGQGFVASIATEEGTEGSARGEDGDDSLRCHFKAEEVAFESMSALFFYEPPPLVFAILTI